MILLFNKVYLKVDQLIKMERNRIVISKEFGSMGTVLEGFTISNNNVAVAPAMYQAETVQQLIDGQFSSDYNQFFRMLMAQPANQRLTIYCDADAMVELMLRFWKTLLPQMSDEGFYTLLNFTVSQFVEVLGIGFLSFTKLHQTQSQLVRTVYAPLLADENKPAMLQRWNETVPYMLTRTEREAITKSCGLEFQLCTVALTPDWRYSSQFKSKIVRMMHKEMITEYVLDIKYMLLDGLVGFHYFEPATSFDFFTHTLEDLVQMHPEYRFLTDDKFIPDNIDYICATYDFPTLLAIRQKTYKPEHIYSLVWDHVFDNNLTYEQIVAHELASPTVNLFMKRGEFPERVNPYMVDYIFAAMRSGNLEQLVPYKLV
jgi:hypothetical protein